MPGGQGNHMASQLRQEERGFSLVKFICSNRDTPPENKELEEDFKKFLERGITSIVKEGEGLPTFSLMPQSQIISRFVADKQLLVVAGGEERVCVQDNMLKRQEEAKAAKLQAAAKGGSGRFR